MQVTTLYSSYDEYNIDMDILGKVVSIPQLSRDELKEIVFKELQETHPIPKLEDERYKLSRPVDEDYKIQVENYVQQFEDEDLSVDELGEDEDPYNQGTDNEDIYSIGDIYGLDINIFSSPFTEDEVEQATKDIESFLSQKVRRFKQNKAEYEKRSVVSLEELRAMYQTRVHIQDSEESDDDVMEDTLSLEEKEAVSEEQADEVMEDTLSLEEKEEVPEEEEDTEEVVSDVQEGTDENYFISEPELPFIRVLIPFISEPDVPYIEVRSTKEQPMDVEEKEQPTEEVVQEPTFIEESSVRFIQVTTETNSPVQEKEGVQDSKSPEFTFIEEPPVDFIQVSNSTLEDSNVEIESTEEVAYFVDEPSIPYIVVSSSMVESLNKGTVSEENSDFFIEEPDISFINVYSSENQEYSEEGNDSDSDFTYEGSDEDDPDAYEIDADDEDYDGDEREEDEDDTYDVEDDSIDGEDDSIDEEDEEEGTYDEEDEDDSYDEEGYDEEPEEEDEEDDSTVEAEEDGTYDAGDVSYDEEDTDSSGDDSVEEYDDSLEGYDEDDDASAYEMMTDSEDLDEDVMSYESEDDSTVEEEEHITPTPIPQAVKVPSKPVVPEQEIQVKPRASALTKRVHKPNPEPVVQSPKTSVTPQVKEKKGSDTLNSKKVSESLDPEVSFMNKSKVTDTKPKASTKGTEITKVPRDLVEFLRLYPRTPYKVAVQYFGEKEVKRQLKMGRIYQNGKYLVI